MNRMIGIIGAGPAGCALACLLQEKNINCIVFDSGKTPDLIVGESLVPAIIPIFRQLGIEQRVAEISHIKHGAALRHPNGTRVDFKFQRFGKKYPDYSYNVPRPAFDNILRERAKELGVKFIAQKAGIESSPNTTLREIQLDEQSLKAAGLNRASQPDILVDATGRSRLFSRFLDIPYQKGKRDDVSYFAHYENFKNNANENITGQIVLSILDSGWSWQIPQKNCLSVGVVLDKKTVRQYGRSSEERLENIIEASPLLSKNGQLRKRVTSVKSYSNYQLLSNKGYGKGWVLLGDAFGFVDPMLSPGLHMSLESAVLLEKHVLSKSMPSNENFDLYCQDFNEWHHAWSYLVEFFYDGRILNMGAARETIQRNTNPFYLPRLIEPYISRMLSSLVSGIKTRSKFNQQVLKHISQHVTSDPQSVANHAIQSTIKESLISNFDIQNKVKKTA